MSVNTFIQCIIIHRSKLKFKDTHIYKITLDISEFNGKLSLSIFEPPLALQTLKESQHGFNEFLD